MHLYDHFGQLPASNVLFHSFFFCPDGLVHFLVASRNALRPVSFTKLCGKRHLPLLRCCSRSLKGAYLQIMMGNLIALVFFNGKKPPQFSANFFFLTAMYYPCNDGGFCDRRLQFVIAFLSNTDVFTTESMQKYEINGADFSDFCPPKVYMNLDFTIMQHS